MVCFVNDKRHSQNPSLNFSKDCLRNIKEGRWDTRFVLYIVTTKKNISIKKQ